MEFCVPIRGTASDVVGIDSATRFRNTVSDSRIVTPEIIRKKMFNKKQTQNTNKRKLFELNLIINIRKRYKHFKINFIFVINFF